jgi:multiple sugar transport system substrate-binding protein
MTGPAVRRLAVLLLLLAACTGDTSTDTATVSSEAPTSSTTASGPARDPIVLWSTDTEEDGIAATQAILAGFTGSTGIPVDLVLVEEGALRSAMVSNAAAGSIPDVVLHPMELTAEWAAAGYLDPGAAQATINNLGRDTFSAGALDLARMRGQVAAVPVHGWGLVIVYRKDVFEVNGLEVPDTLERIEAAAKALHDPENEFFGIAAASDPGQVFTQHSFEFFALAGGCELTQPDGTVTLDSAECITTFEFYTDLIRTYAAPAVEGIAETRRRYADGKAAMLVWPTYIMDELAGLRDAALPACSECDTDPAYLARNSGIVASISGRGGTPVSYGQTVNLGIGLGGDVEAARRLVEYWLTDGYVQWLGVSPESRVPVRRGTPGDPETFVEAWPRLETGVDRRAPLGDFYGSDVAVELAEGLDGVRRWGFVRGQGSLVAAIYDRLPVAEEIAAVVRGVKSADEGLREAQRKVEVEQRLLS